MSDSNRYIGTQQFDSFQGSISGIGQRVDSREHAGVDGKAYMRMGLRPVQDRVITGIGCADGSAAAAIKAAAAQSKGYIGQVIDAFGATFPYVMVIDVQVTDEHEIKAGAGPLAGDTVYLELTWLLENTAW